jgi:Flp pilus assembly protein TadD
MVHRSTHVYGGLIAPRRASAWRARLRHALPWLCVAGTAGYPVALHYLLSEAPAVGQRLLAIGFAVLAVTTYVLLTEPKGLFERIFQLLRRGRRGGSERYLAGRRIPRQRMIPIPGLGDISLRLTGGAAVLLIAGGWWLTPWTPVRVRPPALGDVTGMLAEDLVAAMLVLPNDHTAVVQPPQVPPRLRSQTRWIREDAAYPLAMRCLAAEDFAGARSHLARAAEMQELESLPLQVLGAQVEMYAARFPDAARAYNEALKQKSDDPMLWCQLAVAYIQAGEFDSARQPVEAAVRLCRAKGDQAQREMAACRHLQGLLAMARCKDFDQAVQLIEDARESCKKAMGEDHVLVAANLNNQAVLYVLRANYPGARELLDFSLAIGTKSRGAGDPHVTAVRCNLALLSYCQGQYAKAAELLGQAAPRAAEAAPQNHPARLAALNLQAVLSRARGRPATDESDPALAALKEAQVIFQKTLEPEHPLAAVLADSLADVYADHAQHAKALQQALDADRITRRVWGPEHPFMAEQLNHLSAIRTLQQDYAEADALCQKAQKIAERAFGKRHPAVADVLATRGRLEIAQDRPRNAAKPLGRARDIYEMVYGKEHPAVARTLGDMATVAIEQEKFAEAKECLDRAWEIQGKMLVPDHPDLAATLTIYAVMFDKMTPADPGRAAEVRAQAAEILAKHRRDDQ